MISLGTTGARRETSSSGPTSAAASRSTNGVPDVARTTLSSSMPHAGPPSPRYLTIFTRPPWARSGQTYAIDCGRLSPSLGRAYMEPAHDLAGRSRGPDDV